MLGSVGDSERTRKITLEAISEEQNSETYWPARRDGAGIAHGWWLAPAELLVERMGQAQKPTGEGRAGENRRSRQRQSNSGLKIDGPSPENTEEGRKTVVGLRQTIQQSLVAWSVGEELCEREEKEESKLENAASTVGQISMDRTDKN